MPERQYAEVGDAQSRSPLSIDLHGPIQLQHSFFSNSAILTETFDFENTSVGLKADLPQRWQVTQSFADGKVAGVVDGCLGAGAHFAHCGNLLEILLDARVLIVDVQRGNHTLGEHARTESSRRSL